MAAVSESETGMSRRVQDNTPEAEALFARFADRYGLRYDVDVAAPVEVWWNFPVQDRLHRPIVLALQNDDELNFGGGEFWSYFFPFEKVVQRFEEIIDAWIIGEARIAPVSPWTDALQVRQGGGQWETCYCASRILPNLGRRPALHNR